jgi:hypothetical protein
LYFFVLQKDKNVLTNFSKRQKLLNKYVYIFLTL